MLAEQIKAQKKNKQEHLKDLFYVDYCNNCKDPDIRGTYGKTYTPCHHPWYCHHDNGEAQNIEYQLATLNKPRLTSQEYEHLKNLKQKKWELIHKSRRHR